MSTGRGVTDVKIYTPAAVLERFGVTPAQIPDYIGLKGDTSDNIPGVPGVGEKTAAQLLQQFGSIEELYRRLDEVKSEKRRALLKEHEEAARLSLQLATMVLDVPLEHDLVELVTSCGYRLPVESVDAVFERFEFRNLRRRLQEIAGAGGGARRRPRRRRGRRARAPCRRAGRRPRRGAAREGGGRARLRAARRRRDGLAVAAHAGGDACLVAPADAGRAGSLWLLAGHAVAHDAKAQPGFVNAPVGAGVRHRGRRVPARAGAAGEGAHAVRARRRRRRRAARRGTGGRGRRGHARHAHVARGRGTAAAPRRARPRAALPRGRAAARARPRADGGRRRQDGPVPARRDHGARARPHRRAQRRDHRASPAARSPSARRSSWPRCSSCASASRRPGRARPGSRPTPGCCAACATSTPSCRRSRSGGSSPSCSTPTSSRSRRASTRPPAGSTPRSTSSSRPPAGSRAPTRTCRTSRCAPSSGRRSAPASSPRRAASCSSPTTRRSSSGSWRRSPREPALLDAYHRGEDVHRVTAAAVAGIPVEEVTKRQRERAKATNFGIMYGLSAFGLSEQVDMPVDEARAFIEAYFAKYPHVKEFRERVIAQAAQDGFVTTLFGRRRAVPELRSSNFRNRSLGERLAVNTILQGTAADIIKVAMVDGQPRAGAPRAGVAAGAAGARRARPRVPRGRGRRVPADAPRRHVRRARARPAARGRDGRRRRLGGGEGLTPAPPVRRARRRSIPPPRDAILRWFRLAAVREPLPSVSDGPHT